MRLLFERVAHRVALGRAGAAERVVTADGVGGDRQHRAAEIGEQHRAGAEIDVALLANGVGSAE